jgi:hypothetical protein
MEIRIVIFLFFVFVTVTSNTLLIWFAYKAFAGVTSKVTETVAEFEKNSETRAWIDTLQVAAAEAAAVTEATKRKLAEFEPMLVRVQENYNRTLAQVDSRLESVAEEISTGARQMRDVVAKPAFSIMAFAAGLARVIDSPEDE